jgi:tetratricopeptide (TPR) repeat protein
MLSATQSTTVIDAATKWAAAHDTSLGALTPAQKKEIVADVAKETNVPAVQVTEALLASWTAANERGLQFGKIGGEWQYQGGAQFKPMQTAKGGSATQMMINNRMLGTVATYAALPNDTKANELANTGFTMDKAGNHLGAIELYQEAIQLDPTNAAIRNRLGLALKHLGKSHFDEALAAIHTALTLDPAHPPSHYNAACIAALAGDADLAAQHLSQALAAKPEFFAELAAGDKDFKAIGGGAALVDRALALN